MCAMPPGAIGARQLARAGLGGFFQPVEIKAPAGALVSLAEEGGFSTSQPAPFHAGLAIGPVYRLRVTNIPLSPGMEVFPTIEVIDRLWTPQGQQLRFPIQIELTQEDLTLRLERQVRHPRDLPRRTPRPRLPWPKILKPNRGSRPGPAAIPLAIADQLGRPVAILRMGARLPVADGSPDMEFLYGCPPWMRYPEPSAEPSPAIAKELP